MWCSHTQSRVIVITPIFLYHSTLTCDCIFDSFKNDVIRFIQLELHQLVPVITLNERSFPSLSFFFLLELQKKKEKKKNTICHHIKPVLLEHSIQSNFICVLGIYKRQRCKGVLQKSMSRSLISQLKAKAFLSFPHWNATRKKQ